MNCADYWFEDGYYLGKLLGFSYSKISPLTESEIKELEKQHGKCINKEVHIYDKI